MNPNAALVVMRTTCMGDDCETTYQSISSRTSFGYAVRALLGYEEDCDLAFLEWMETNEIKVVELVVVYSNHVSHINVDTDMFWKTTYSFKKIFEDPQGGLIINRYDELSY